jgi:polyphosphate kinase
MSPRAQSVFLNREISWLEFNGRVLQEAQDPKTPLLERVRFFCIFHSNLDEFFMVRVASLHRKLREGNKTADSAGLDPQRQLDQVSARVRELLEASSKLYEEKLAPALSKEKIRILRTEELSPTQQAYLDEFFDREVYPILTPIAVDQDHPYPRITGLAVSLAVLLQRENSPNRDPRLALVQVPGRLPGLCRLPESDGVEVSWLSDVIRRNLGKLFPGYGILEVAGFRVARDSEVELDDEGQDDYVRMLESELKKRRKAQPIRVEYEEGMSAELLDRLERGIGLNRAGFMAVRGPLDPRPLLSLVDLPGLDRLRHKPQPPLMPVIFEQDRKILDLIREGDILLHHPYDSFDPVLEFIQEAAEDPDVLAIKQVLYRTSGKASPLVRALLHAAETGKQVTVLIELTARFDEERNISWARDLEDAGAHVLYGLAGLKVHAKIALVVRREASGIRRYVHLGTGNYNERTARLYTDFGFLTSAEEIGDDASAFFNTITGYSEPRSFSRLVMAPLGLRERVLSLIRREADWARSGQVSGILAKMNSLVDPLIVEELCAAAAAGVSIRLNVRGICCLRPGVPKQSENIKVVSIVDRYLEHSRAFAFRNGGNTEVYLSSADWMPRNLDRRVELMFPVILEDHKARVIEALEAAFSDNQKARVLKPDGTYERVGAGRSEPVRAQELLYRRAAEDRERIRAVTPVRFEPLEGKH